MTNTESKKGKSPTHSAYHVRQYGRGKSYWTKIGSAWPHEDGQGFTLQLNGLAPLDGKITVRPVKEKQAAVSEA